MNTQRASMHSSQNAYCPSYEHATRSSSYGHATGSSSGTDPKIQMAKNVVLYVQENVKNFGWDPGVCKDILERAVDLVPPTKTYSFPTHPTGLDPDDLRRAVKIEAMRQDGLNNTFRFLTQETDQDKLKFIADSLVQDGFISAKAGRMLHKGMNGMPAGRAVLHLLHENVSKHPNKVDKYIAFFNAEYGFQPRYK